MSETNDQILDDTGKPIIIYVLYLVALVTAVPFFVGVILAYLFRSEAPAWSQSHMDHAISLFWRFVIGNILLLALFYISFPLMLVLVGFLTIAVAGLGFVYLWIWMLFRCLKGIGAAREQRPYPGNYASFAI